MKSSFKKMAIMLVCMSVLLSYMPWNAVIATDEIAETPHVEAIALIQKM